jgi:type IV pilus assembly protein PilQ
LERHKGGPATVAAVPLLCALLLIPAIFAFSGCAGKQETAPIPWKEWEARAKKARGTSPDIEPESRRLRQEPEKREQERTAPPSKEEEEKSLPRQPVTLKMRDANVRIILRALARAADQDLLLTSGVQGRMSVRIQQKPWRDAFKGILKSQGLEYVWEGDILRVTTLQEMRRDLQMAKLKVQRQKQRKAIQQAQPLRTQTIKVNFADAAALKENIQRLVFGGAGQNATRGQIVVNKETNSLLVQAVPEDLRQVNKLVKRLDEPRKQINIKAKIVEATENVARELGVQWGGRVQSSLGGGDSLVLTPGGTAAGSGSLAAGGAYDPATGDPGISGQGFNVNLPVQDPSSSLGLLVGSLGDDILDAQLTALSRDSKANIISSPYITTLDNQEAVIKSGQEVPFVSRDEEGESNVQFKEAVMQLSIVPHVINEKYLQLDIHITKDDVDFSEASRVLGNPTIIKKETRTRLIARDDETIVISGLTEEQSNLDASGVPWLEDIPLLGLMFQNQSRANDKDQLLIFITPDILPQHPQAEQAAEEPPKN